MEVEYLWIKDSQTTYLPHFDANIFFPNLIKYLVTSSKLKFVKREDFSGMPKLQTLVLDDNLLEDIPEDALNEVTQLVDFFIDKNKFTKLPPYLLSKATMFQRFKANNNTIEAIPPNFFKNNPSLKIVSLDNNKISRIGVDFRPFKNLKKVDLKNNTCIDSNFNDWRKHKTTTILQGEIDATCK